MKQGLTSAKDVPSRLFIYYNERVIERTGSHSKTIGVPYDEVYGQGIEDMLHRQPSIDKVTSAVGWEPTFGLDGILEDVIRHVRAEPVLVER